MWHIRKLCSKHSGERVYWIVIQLGILCKNRYWVCAGTSKTHQRFVLSRFCVRCFLVFPPSARVATSLCLFAQLCFASLFLAVSIWLPICVVRASARVSGQARPTQTPCKRNPIARQPRPACRGTWLSLCSSLWPSSSSTSSTGKSSGACVRRCRTRARIILHALNDARSRVKACVCE